MENRRKYTNRFLLRIITKTRELLSDPGRWTKGRYARTADGLNVSPHREAATCFCLVGAIKRSTANNDQEDSVDDAISATLRSRGFFEGVINFNDRPETTHADVLKLLDETAEHLREHTDDQTPARPQRSNT